VNVISKSGLVTLAEGKGRDVYEQLCAWYRVAKSADWTSFVAVQQDLPRADLVDRKLVFDICGNRFRLIVSPVFSGRRLYVKDLLTHAEYDRGLWKAKWP
jgi:mRNA interferase HigB